MTDLHTENARLRAALLTCINMLDDLVAESGRGIEYGEEDAFRMGEWFDDHDLGQIDTARAALATPAPDAVQEAARVAEIAALIEAADNLMLNYLQDELCEPDLCVDDEHWAAIHDFNAALRAIAGDRT